MSLWHDELKPTAFTLATLVVLAAVAVGSLGRVVEAPGAVVYGATATAVGAAFALYFGPRSLGAGFGLLLLGGAATLPALFTREITALPSPSAFGELSELISAGLAGIPRAVPPVAAEEQYLVLIWVAMLLLGFLCASWVVVRRPLGAVVSLLAVVTFTGSVGDAAGRNGFALAAVAATGAFFLAEGRHRIRWWGGRRIRVRPWLGVPTLAVACVVALAAPAVIGDSPIVELQSPGRPRVVVIKPLSDIRRQLEVEPPIEVLRVTSDQPAYWRLTGLDSYDGQEWVLEARPRDVREGDIGDPHPPSTGPTLDQRYTLTSLLSPWLPAAYAATEVDVPAEIQVDESSHTLLLRDDTPPGLTYTVSSRLPSVDSNLPAAPLEVDDETERSFGLLAASIVDGATTPFDIAQRLEDHFRGFAYDEDVEGGHSVARLERFLEERAGYCEQFAATMTLMLRGLGIDARVGVGFLPGAREGGTYFVSTRDAHAWVEVDIPGAGWVIFDPTPGRAESAGLPPQEAPPPPATPEEPVAEPTPVAQPTPVPADPPPGVSDPDGGTTIPRPALRALLAVALAATTPATKGIRRSRRRRSDPKAAVTGAWAELCDRAADLGWNPLATETLSEFSQRVLPQAGSAQDLARRAARALYGQGEPSSRDAQAAWTAEQDAARCLRQKAPAWRRLLAPFDPRTLVGARPARRARLRLTAALGRG